MFLRQKLIFAYLFSVLAIAVAFGVVASVAVKETTTLHVNEVSEAALDSLAAELKLEVKNRIDSIQSLLLAELSRGKNATARDSFIGLPLDAQSELFSARLFRKINGQWRNESKFVNEKLLSTRKLPADLPDRLKTYDIKNYKGDGVTLLNRSLVGTVINQAQDALVLSLIIPGTLIGEKAESTVVIGDFLQDRIRQIVLREGRGELFLMGSEGSLLIHPSIQLTAKYAELPFEDFAQPELLNPPSLSSLTNLKVHRDQLWARSGKMGLSGVVGVVSFPLESYLVPWLRASQRILAALGVVSAIFFLYFLAFGVRLKIRLARMIESCNKLGNPKIKPEFEKGDDELGALGKRLNGVYDQFRNYLAEAVQIAKEQDVKVTDQLLESTSYGISPITTLAVDTDLFVDRCRERPGYFGETVWWGQWLGLFVGNATSPGFAGSLTATAARSALLSFAQKSNEQSPNPAEILARIHQVLLARGNGAFGVAAFLCFVNLETGEIRVSSANQRGPLLLHRVRGKVEDLSLEGSWLGLKSRPKLGEAQYQMEIGDSLLFCSSGIFDATDSHGKILGDSGISRILVEGREKSIDLLKEKIAGAFRSHLGEMALTDDAVFWLVQWKRRLSEVAPPMGGKKDPEILWKQEEKNNTISMVPEFGQEEAVRDALNFDAKEIHGITEEKTESNSKKVA